MKGYDYTQAGVYFVTLVTKGRVCLFGEIIGEEMRINGVGRVVQGEWKRLRDHFHNLRLDEFVIMPNHMHGIIEITEKEGAAHSFNNLVLNGYAGATRDLLDKSIENNDIEPIRAMVNSGGSPLRSRPVRPHGPAAGSVGAIIGQFKSRVTKCLKLTGGVWQRNYYEHIIRDDEDWERIHQYIWDNPQNWDQDEEHV
jgi:REP-associated tyrosine transposase